MGTQIIVIEDDVTRAEEVQHALAGRDVVIRVCSDTISALAELAEMDSSLRSSLLDSGLLAQRAGNLRLSETRWLGDLEIDVDGHRVLRAGRVVPLTPLEFRFVLTLARAPWKAFSRDELLREVWGYEEGGDSRVVNVHVQRIRAKIEHDPEHPELIVTVRGVGYRAGDAIDRTQREQQDS